MVLRKRWFTDAEILRQNTSYAAKWLAKSGTKNPYREGPLGVIEVGAYADVLLVEGNPLEDVAEHLIHFARSEQAEYDKAVTDYERARYFERI